MRLRLAVKTFTAVAALSLMTAAAHAQSQTPDNTATRDAIATAMSSPNPQQALQQYWQQRAMQQQQAQAGQAGMMYGGGMPGMIGMPFMQEQPPAEITQDEMNALLKDPDSPQYKANKLADKAKRDGVLLNFADNADFGLKKEEIERPTPPEMETLQNIHKANDTNYGIIDAAADAELMDLDIRRDAQKEAALSYGARGGLAKKAYQITERLEGFEKVLDGVFNFRALLIAAPSGLLIEPPIVRESIDSLTIISDGNEAAVADRILNISKQAKIVSAPRDWRQYLAFPYDPVIPPPPKVLWPKNREEQANWDQWVRQGWEAGFQQGEDTFETNLNRMVADYNGMVRYRMLLAQGMISQPYALHEDRGVTGSKTEMRVGDRAVRITGPSQFLTGSDLWKPADR